MKTHSTTSLAHWAAALILASSGIAPSADAQGASPGQSVLIVLPDTFQTANARAVLLRNSQKEDIIAFNSNGLTPDEIIAALSLLQQMRDVPLPSGVATEAVVISGSAPITASDHEKIDKAAALLTELLARSSVNVGSLGRGRWIRLPELRI
jgi:ketopantoate reductase